MSAHGGARRGARLLPAQWRRRPRTGASWLAALAVGLLWGAAAAGAGAKPGPQASEQPAGRATRTIVLRAESVQGNSWTEAGAGLGSESEPEVGEGGYYTTTARHRPLTVTLEPVPALGPGEVVTQASLHALTATGRKGVTMRLSDGPLTLAIPKGSTATAWHQTQLDVEGDPPSGLRTVSVEKTWGSRSATVFDVYVTLTVETERARFADAHGSVGRAGEAGIYVASTNQALPGGQSIYVFLLTRGAHGASGFHDQLGNVWQPIYERASGPFVCQLWASQITHASTEKGIALTWEGLPPGAPVYHALVALEGEPVVQEALDVAGAATTAPGAEQVSASTDPTRAQGDFAMALVASTDEDELDRVAPEIEGWSDPAPTASVGAGLSATFAFQSLPAESAPLAVSAGASEPGRMSLFVVAVKVLANGAGA